MNGQADNGSLELALADEDATGALGAQLARCLPAGGVVHLGGDLGAGKTTLARGFLRGLGYERAVRSPTFTLIEPYEFDGHTVVHMDLYRLTDPEELEFMGIRDYAQANVTMLVEWAARGGQLLPDPDLVIELAVAGPARRVRIAPRTRIGAHAVSCLVKI